MNSVESIKEVAMAVVKSSARRPECADEPASKKLKIKTSSSYRGSNIAKAIDIVLLRAMSQCRLGDILSEPTVLEELMKVDGLSDEQKLLDIQLDKVIDFQAIRDQLRSKLENN
eukprot:g47638.t1